MSRPPRIEVTNGIYHVYSRGNRKCKIFENDRDKAKIIDFMAKGKDKFNFYILGYVLMSNHYHFLIQTMKANLSKIMHYVNSAYANYYNFKHSKNGHLFQGRYSGLLVEDGEYFHRVTAYLHNNPVKAGMVKHPGNYKWSSYKDYISGKGDGVVDKNILDRYFHMAPLEYEAYVLSELKNDNDVMSDIYAGCILGKKQFIDNILRERKIEVKNGEISFRKKIKGTGPADISIDEIGDMVASEFGVNSIDLYKNANIPMVERKAGIYLTKELTGLSNAKIGEKYGISYSAVSKAWKSFACEMEDGGIVEKVGRIISHFKG